MDWEVHLDDMDAAMEHEGNGGVGGVFDGKDTGLHFGGAGGWQGIWVRAGYGGRRWWGPPVCCAAKS